MLRIPLPSAAHSGAYIPEDDGFALAVPDDKRRGEIKDIKDFNDIKDAPKRLSFKSPLVPSHDSLFKETNDGIASRTLPALCGKCAGSAVLWRLFF